MAATDRGAAGPSAVPEVFDRRLLAARRRRAARHGGEGFVAAAVAADMAERLATVSRRFSVALDLGSGGRVAALLAAGDRADQVVVAEPLALDPEPLAAGDPSRRPADLVVDEEHLPFAPGSFDLVTAALSLAAVNDLPGTFIQIRRMLKPDGLFLAALPGGDTLAELRRALITAEVEETGGAAPRVAPFADVRALTGLLQRTGFAMPVGDVDRLTVRYGDAFGLLRDLRRLGATSVLADRPRRPLRRAVLARAAALYAEANAETDGRVRATLDIVSLSGWAPPAQDPSKQDRSATGAAARASEMRHSATGLTRRRHLPPVTGDEG